jgi:MFS family permease
MNDISDTGPMGAANASYADLFRGGRAILSVLIIMGAALHALQIMVIAIIMPTVVGDIGGESYFAWPAMIYSVGAILGAASVGPVWGKFGGRRGYGFSGLAFLAATIASAMAPDMGTLIAARALQGVAGGLILGGSMALIGVLFDAALRTRILAIYQGTWMVVSLLGPLLGGAFAEIGWWRGSFWVMVPFVLVFTIVAWLKIPDQSPTELADKPSGGFPVLRLGLITTGVLAVGVAGPIGDASLRAAFLAAAILLIGLCFRLDRQAEIPLFPRRAVSLMAPIGLVLWILFLVGAMQSAVTIFLPLLLQIVHGVTPLFISFVTIVISAGWTVGTFGVSNWTGFKERLALLAGPPFMLAGLAIIWVTAQAPLLWLLTAGAFLLGLGIGTHNVHMVARSMAGAEKGEERITASAMTSMRTLGGAFGAAMAGMLATIGGLTDVASAAAVGGAVSFVYGLALIPLAFTVVFMVWLVHLWTRAEPVSAPASP